MNRRYPAAVILVLIGLGAAAPTVVAQRSSYREMRRLSEVLNLVRLNYVESRDQGLLVDAAISGILSSLDPHSYYMSDSAWQWQESRSSGDWASVGIAIHRAGDVTRVMSVDPEGPAYRAGVRTGDRLIMIDTLAARSMTVNEIAQYLDGEEGSRIELGFERGAPPDLRRFDARLRRKRPSNVSVSDPVMLDDSTAFVSVRFFGPGTSDELEGTLDDVVDQGDAVILDLRDNPGGSLLAAAQVAWLFLDSGEVAFRTRGSKRELEETFAATERGRFFGTQVVLLVNGGSASASEALAAALQDNRRARVVGSRSFGKALMQLPFPVEGGVLMMTVGYVQTPMGRVIQRPYHGLSDEDYRTGQGPIVLDTIMLGDRPVELGDYGIVPDIEASDSIVVAPWFMDALLEGTLTARIDSLSASGRLRSVRDWSVAAHLAEEILEEFAAADSAEVVESEVRFVAYQLLEQSIGVERARDLAVARDPVVLEALEHTH